MGLSKLIDESGLVDSREHVLDQVLLFQTPKQRTWFLVTEHQLFCILDDAKTRSSGRLIQWRMPLDSAGPVRARTSLKRGNAVVDIGVKRGWLYSRDLHPVETELEKRIRDLVAKGKRANL